jgi:hypothetical protein
MRVSSLSDERVIAVVSRYFVPVWFSRDHYGMEPPARADAAEIDRIDHERAARRLDQGTVCVILLAPDGKVSSILSVQKACRPDNLLPFLREAIRTGKLKPRDPAAARAGAARPAPPVSARTPNGMLLHVWTRGDTGPNRGTSHDRVELTAAEWSALVPAGKARVGASWPVPAKQLDKLLRCCYPPLPHWQASKARVAAARFRATVMAVSAAEVRVRLEGDLELIYPYTGKPDDARVTARLHGLLRYDPGKRAVRSFLLASEAGRFVWYWKGKPQPAEVSIVAEAEPTKGG